LTLVSQSHAEIVLDITCSKGTYVRSIAEDLGEAIGCGAHVIALQRLESGPFGIEDTCSLAALRQLRESGGVEAIDKMLLPESSAVEDWPAVELTELTASYLKQGQPVQIPNAPTEGWVRIFSESGGASERRDNGNFLGVGEILEDGRIAPRRLVVMQD
jgi:tRNA pseudouridine55 synthase